jgi:hypothetical protein
MNPFITDVSQANLRIEAKFARLNKNGTLREYQNLVATGPDAYHDWLCQITHFVFFAPDDYDAFANRLISDMDWFPTLGGIESDMSPKPDGDYYTWTPEQQAEYSRLAYRVVFAVVAPNRPMFFVDPQGYQYARYVGL